MSKLNKFWIKTKKPLVSFLMYLIGLATDDIKEIIGAITDLIIEIIKNK